MKEKVLAFLTAQEGAFVSGAAVSQALGVTRAAVWKAVQALQAEGYRIEAVPRKGYRLLDGPDRLSEAHILPLLKNDHRDSLICLKSVDSTNNFAKTLSVQGRGGTCYIVTDEQTGGRGRRGRSFYSPAGQGVYLTGLYHPDVPPSRVSHFTAYVAAAVCRAIESTTACRPAVKWPNDILLSGKKVCGILTEMALEGETGLLQYLITGMGVNVGQLPEDFPEEIRPLATSLKAESGTDVKRSVLCAALINELDDAYDAFLKEDKDYWTYYRARCITLGSPVWILSGDRKEPAFAQDLAGDFGLIVRWENGSLETVYAGEVSLRSREE